MNIHSSVINSNTPDLYVKLSEDQGKLSVVLYNRWDPTFVNDDKLNMFYFSV